MKCRFEGCTNQALKDQSRCADHRMRWLPGKDPEPVPMSPWVRKALDGTLPPKVAA